MRTFVCITIVLIVCVHAFLPGNSVYAAPNDVDSTNLLLNGGFEEGDFSPSGSPDHWSRDVFDASAELLWDDAQAYEGQRNVKVSAATANDARWVQTVPVQPQTNYRVSGWIKTEDVGHTVQSVDNGAHLSILGAWDFHSMGLFGTNDWTYVSFAFNSGDNTEVIIAARLGFWSGTTTGTAWFDDIEMAPIQASDPHPGWKILVLIFDTVDFTHIDSLGVSHHYFSQMTREEKEQAALSATKFVEEDIPALNSGNMVPTITIRYPARSLTELTPHGSGWSPGPWDVVAERDPAFDSVIVIWDPVVLDEATGETTFIGAAAGLASRMGIGQTYTAIIVDAVTTYGHRNVFKHEWGHTILFFYEALGTAPKPAVDNHAFGTPETQYVHCPSGEAYILVDETEANPVPNSIYNNDSGFTHDYYSGTTATADQPTRCLGITPEAWASGGSVSGPLRPPQSPTQSLQSIRDNVDQLVLSGSLTKGRAKSLYATLDAAHKALENEREKVTVKLLQVFIKKVETLIKTNRLTQTEGRILIDQTTAFMDQVRE